MLLGCYRTGEAHDPEIYIAAVVRVLSNYPIEVARGVADPVSGIPGKIKWLPTIAEVKEACHSMVAVSLRMAEWDKRAAEQLAERPKLLAAPKQSYADFRKEMAARGMPLGGRCETYETPDSVKAKLGISDEAWDALPKTNAKDWKEVDETD